MLTMRPTPRPYRSHKVPACDHCRRRKVGCKIDVSGEKCRLCKDRNWECTFSGESETLTVFSKKRRLPSSAEKDRNGSSRDQAPADTAQGQGFSQSVQSQPYRQDGTADNESAIIIGPAFSNDVQVLRQHMRSQEVPEISDDSPSRPYNCVDPNDLDPVLYLSVPKRRKGLRLAEKPGEKQKEIMDQILAPYAQELVALYFRHVNPAFPILDEEEFTSLFRSNSSKLPPALVCDLYAVTLFFWDLSPKLKKLPRPDMQYAWNQAVAALSEDFHAPGLQTIQAALLDLSGRPVLSVKFNIINVGRTVSLAHSLGLNRNPLSWKMPDPEKNLRIRLWWGLLIHDHWSSFALGVPANICRDQYDVPLPSIENLVPGQDRTELEERTAECFVQLCQLTELLGRLLPLVHNVREKSKDIVYDVQDISFALGEWESRLPDYLSPGDYLKSESVPGLVNLRFCTFTLRLFIKRVYTHVCKRVHIHQPDYPKLRETNISIVRTCAIEASQFICSITKEMYKEFWLAYTAHLLAFVAVILMRCMIQTDYEEEVQSCKHHLLQLQTKIRSAKDKGWDLENIFMDQCDEIITKLVSEPFKATLKPRRSQQSVVPTEEPSENPIENPFGLIAFDESFDSPGYSWASLWDTLDGPIDLGI